MPAWLVPALKAVLPHVGTIISAAKPVFTSKAPEAAASQASLLQQQITELQAAASGNDNHIRALAAQIETTVEAIEKVATLADARYRRLQLYAICAVLLSFAALGISMLLFLSARAAA